MHAISKIKSIIRLMDRYEFSALLSLKLKTDGSYFLKLEFDEPDAARMEELKYIGRTREPIPFKCATVPEDLGIRFIVVSARLHPNKGSVVWRCHTFRELLS